MKKCILYEDRSECISCMDCRCDMDPEKVCDNCMQCVTDGCDYRAISISGIMLEHEKEQ